MFSLKSFPRAGAVCSVLCLLTITVAAQTETRPRHAIADSSIETTTNTIMRLENEPFVVSQAPVAEHSPSPSPKTAMPAADGRHQMMLLTAIDMRLGTPYRLGATGPYRYDCSGFVWSVFQSAGIDFERSTARSLWERFAPATEVEKQQFGTLVFFNNQHHVGIVADANGFYHASSSKGVVYSTFNDYWLARIDGFRRVRLPSTQSTSVAAIRASTR